MGSTAFDEYVAGIDPATVPLVAALDDAVRDAHGGFDVAVKYKILMYAMGGDWRHWVCAIAPAKRGASLKFLFGVLLDDPRHVLRPGSSVLMSWDFALDTPIDREAVVAYVREAVAKYPSYRADSARILEESHEAAVRAGRRRE